MLKICKKKWVNYLSQWPLCAPHHRFQLPKGGGGAPQILCSPDAPLAATAPNCSHLKHPESTQTRCQAVCSVCLAPHRSKAQEVRRVSKSQINTGGEYRPPPRYKFHCPLPLIGCRHYLSATQLAALSLSPCRLQKATNSLWLLAKHSAILSQSCCRDELQLAECLRGEKHGL